MRKLIALIAAAGFIGSTTLSPVIAAPATPGVTKSDELSAAAKSKKKSKKKKAEIVATDVSAAAKSKKKAKKQKKADNVILYRIAA